MQSQEAGFDPRTHISPLAGLGSRLKKTEQKEAKRGGQKERVEDTSGSMGRLRDALKELGGEEEDRENKDEGTRAICRDQ